MLAKEADDVVTVSPLETSKMQSVRISLPPGIDTRGAAEAADMSSAEALASFIITVRGGGKVGLRGVSIDEKKKPTILKEG
jgi:hypothetical protein